MLLALEVQGDRLRMYLDVKKETRENPDDDVVQYRHRAVKEDIDIADVVLEHLDRA
jgi:hypothetical protein